MADVCTYGCGFCAFSKGKLAEDLRGSPYLIDLQEVERRTAEAWDRGASEVCMQGGIHPDFTGLLPTGPLCQAQYPHESKMPGRRISVRITGKLSEPGVG